MTMREKGRDLTQSYDKAPTPTEMSKVTTQRHKKNSLTERLLTDLGTVSWSNHGHPTGVVNLVFGPNLPTPRNSRIIKSTRV